MVFCAIAFFIQATLLCNPAAVEATGCPEFSVELPRTGVDAVRASDFGFSVTNDRNASAINRALAEAKRMRGARVELAPGTYRCFDEPGIVLDGFEDFTFDGKDAVLVFRRGAEFSDRPSSAFDPGSANLLVRDSTRTLVENLAMDWDWESDPLAGFAVARDVFLDDGDPQGSWVDFEFADYDRHPLYPRHVPVQMMVGMDGSRTRYSPGRSTVQFGLSEGHFGAKSEWTATNILRVWPRVPMPGHAQSRWFAASLDASENRAVARGYEKGGLYCLRHCYYGKNAVNLVSNSDFTLRNVHVWSCFGMGLAIDGAQHHFQIEDFSVAPPTEAEFARAYPGAEFRPRPVSSTADAIHVHRSQGWGRFLRCRVSLNSDDSVNIHDRFTLAVRASDRILEIINRRGAEYARYESGDELELRGPDFSPAGCRVRLLEVRGERYVVDRDLPPQTGACFLVWNRTYGSDRMHFKDCLFEDTGWRNLFCASDLTIEGCVFRRTLGSALKFLADYRCDRWCEGMGATNLVVRNCLFDGVNVRFPDTPAISTSCIVPEDWNVGSIDPGFVGGGLLVENNVFADPGGPALELNIGKDVVFRGNKVVPGERSKKNPMAGTVRDLRERSEDK